MEDELKWYASDLYGNRGSEITPIKSTPEELNNIEKELLAIQSGLTVSLSAI